MTLSIEELRFELDEKSLDIVVGLRRRSRDLLNSGVFDLEFKNGQSWFDYRIRGEETLDADFERFRFQGQFPFYGNDVTDNSHGRNIPDIGLSRIAPPQFLGKDIVSAYRKALAELCLAGEQPTKYGQIAKTDVENCLTIHDRIVYLGQQVAQFKIENNPHLLSSHYDAIRPMIQNLKREEEVIKRAEELAERYGIKKVEVVKEFFRRIIDLTIQTEIDYIYAKAPTASKKSRLGFGQTVGVNGKHSGWGSH